MVERQDSAVPKAKKDGGKDAKGQPNVRKVNDYLIYMDDFLGEGQYGKVVKAQKIAD
jgi:hypothetical protein